MQTCSLRSLLILAITLIAVAAPAYASTDVQVIDTPYIPIEYEFLYITIGFVCLILMHYFEELEVLFGVISTIAFGIAARFASQVATVESFVLNETSSSATVLHSVAVTPQPILQYFLVVCFLFALVATAYVLFLRKADEKMSGNNGRAQQAPPR